MSIYLFTVNSDYCDYLRATDKNVPFTMDVKASRPFVGIVLQVHNICYYAPLTSPKPKHLAMKNQIDFLKINNGELGAINFNNMIPVHINDLVKIDPSLKAYDTQENKTYKKLLEYQLSWCNKKENKQAILKQAARLYDLVLSDRCWLGLKERCCDFKVDEIQYMKFCEQKGYDVPQDKSSTSKIFYEDNELGL